MTVAGLIFFVGIAWTILSTAAVGVALWGSNFAHKEEAECKADLRRLQDLGIANGRMKLASAEYDQARRKSLVMNLFLAHQTLFLVAGLIGTSIPSIPVATAFSLVVIIKHMLPSFMLLLAQGIIVWSQFLLAINTYRRQNLHVSYGSRERADGARDERRDATRDVARDIDRDTQRDTRRDVERDVKRDARVEDE